MIDGIICQGTTPTQVFGLPCAASEMKEVTVTYSQKGFPILKKKTSECNFEANEITVRLTQEETLRFRAGCPLEIQLKVLTWNGEVIPSPKYRIVVEEILDKEAFDI